MKENNPIKFRKLRDANENNKRRWSLYAAMGIVISGAVLLLLVTLLRGDNNKTNTYTA